MIHLTGDARRALVEQLANVITESQRRAVPHVDDTGVNALFEVFVRNADRQVVESVPILWFPTSCLSADPSRTTIHDVLDWRGRRQHTVLDLDWRPQFWRSPADATAELDQVLDRVTPTLTNAPAGDAEETSGNLVSDGSSTDMLLIDFR